MVANLLIIGSILYCIISLALAPTIKESSMRRYNRKIDKLYAYVKKEKSPKLIWVLGTPYFNLTTKKLMDLYWDMVESKEDKFESFFFIHTIKTVCISLAGLVTGAALLTL